MEVVTSMATATTKTQGSIPTKVSFTSIRSTAKGPSITKMEIFIKAAGQTGRSKEKVF